jgi:polyphosphate glucokinase
MNPKQSVSTRRRRTSRGAPRTLAIDIGGSGVKAAVLNGRGGIIGERVRVKTPARCLPAFLIRTIAKLVAAPTTPFSSEPFTSS